MQASISIDRRSIRLSIAAAALATAGIIAAVASANAGSPEVLPVEPDGGIGDTPVVLPVEPDGGIGDTPVILPADIGGGIGN